MESDDSIKSGSADKSADKSEDFLDQDPIIRGQRYVCMSFVSPEDVIVSRDAFAFSKFCESLARDVDGMFASLLTKYPEANEVIDKVRERHEYMFTPNAMHAEFSAFKAANASEVDRDFVTHCGFVSTSLRGFKVRGVYDTLEEGRARAHAIRKFDPKFNVYVAEVGCWCPWSPDPDEIEDQEYAEKQLNTLVKTYNENAKQRDEFYAKRKNDLVATAETKSELGVSVVSEEDVWSEQKKRSESESKEAKGDSSTDIDSNHNQPTSNE